MALTPPYTFRPPMTDAELIRELRRKPYSRVCREAAKRLEELTQYRRGTPRG